MTLYCTLFNLRPYLSFVSKSNDFSVRNLCFKKNLLKYRAFELIAIRQKSILPLFDIYDQIVEEVR